MLPASRATALVVALHLFAGGAGTATAFAPPLPLQHRAPRAGLDAHGAAFRRPALRQARAAPTRMVVLGGNSSPDDIRFESYSYELDGGKPLVVGLAGGTGSGKSTMMDVILRCVAVLRLGRLAVCGAFAVCVAVLRACGEWPCCAPPVLTVLESACACACRELVSHTGGNAGDEVAFLSHDNYYRHRTGCCATMHMHTQASHRHTYTAPLRRARAQSLRPPPPPIGAPHAGSLTDAPKPTDAAHAHAWDRRLVSCGARANKLRPPGLAGD